MNIPLGRGSWKTAFSQLVHFPSEINSKELEFQATTFTSVHLFFKAEFNRAK